MDDGEQAFTEIEINLGDKAHAGYLRGKMEEWFTNEEREKLVCKVGDGRFVIMAPHDLLQRLVGALRALGDQK